MIVTGGPTDPREVAAVIAALEVAMEPRPAPPPLNPWRWAGRRWDGRADWRGLDATAHPSRP